MKSKEAAIIFEALSSESRLGVFRLLVRHTPGGLVAGEISSELNIPPSNLTFHLKALVHSGLANVEKEGRYLRYRADIPLMLELIGYLTSECCHGKPQECLCYPNASTEEGSIILPAYKAPPQKP